MARAEGLGEFESLGAMAFASGFTGGQQGIGDAGHGGDDDHGTALQSALYNLRRAVNGCRVDYRSTAELHYDHERPFRFQVSRFHG